MADNSAAQQGKLSAAKQALFDQWKRGTFTKVASAQRIPQRSDDGPAPLSFAQQRLWFLDQLVSDSWAYVMPLALRLRGRLDRAALEQSLGLLIARHATLRTSFGVRDGQPVQTIAPAPSQPEAARLVLRDLQATPQERREAEVQRHIEQAVRQPFNLEDGPLLRALLLRLDEDEHVLLLTLHHIIADGWSLGVLLRELVALYQGCASGQTAALPPLPIQYADFAAWQRGWVQGELLDRQMAYWKQQLADIPPLLPLPTDHPRPSIGTFRGARQTFALPEPLTTALRSLSQREGVTLFMTLLAAFQTLLARYTGQLDILVGTPIAGRTHVEIEGLIGLFANTLVLRGDLSGNPTFQALLARVRETTLSGFAHQDLPFEQIVEAFQPDRDLSRNPLFQVMFVLQNTPAPQVDLPDLSVRLIDVDSGTAKFDLWLSIHESGSELLGALEYNTDLFERGSIQRLVGHFETLLAAVVAAPDTRLADLPLLTSDEQRQIAAWNATGHEYPATVSLHSLIEAQVARTPDAAAVFFEGQQLSYHELNQRANQLAHHLRALGVGGCPQGETLVGVCLHRSLDLVIALLGVLKAGGAYVPLDPAYPAERLQFMIEDADAPVLLTTAALAEQLPSYQGRIICLDRDEATLSSLPADNPVSLSDPDHSAYMIYTSGSTGQPKGVLNTHRGIVNRLLWMQDTYGLTAADRVLQKTPYSFDVSVWEFFWPLLSGATLVVARPEGHKDAAYLVDLIAEQQITTLHFVPSMLRVFLDEPQIERCASVRRVICSGEALALALQQRFFTKLSAELHNLYGPTEAAVDVTAWACERDTARSSVPIGRPVANTQIYLLDRWLRPVPVGVPGELYIGGVQLARAYHRRPALTAERFIPDPFSQNPGARLYKTGDLARYREDGTIEYLGRIDDQVKLRGFRIELGEIEATLRRHPAVSDTVAVVRDDDDGQRLVAYVVEQRNNGTTEQNEEPGSKAPREQGENQELETWNLKLETRNSELETLTPDQIRHWQQVFDSTYSDAGEQSDPLFNIVGWNSSYTGAPLPVAEMREWVDTTVAQIGALGPRSVFEIGCGTGLLLLRLAPSCAEYWGSDLSQQAIDYVSQQLCQPQLAGAAVKLLRRSADDFSSIPEHSFDLVVLNSVVQYFPQISYLLRVLKGAARAVRPGGQIFIGDVRSLPLLETFHSSVELHRALPDVQTVHLRQRIRRRVAQEQELVIDPAFFAALPAQIPAIRRVELRLKRGRHHNELTKYRYDVVLHLGPIAESSAAPQVLDWHQDRLTLPALRHLLREHAPPALEIRRIPNARLQDDLRAQTLIASPDAPALVGDLRAAIDALDAAPAIDPAELWAAIDALPYELEIGWSQTGDAGSFDLQLRQRGSRGVAAPIGADHLRAVEPRPWQSYANNPLREKVAQVLVPELRGYLQTQLPEYMIPGAIVLLDDLPLTPNGKLDRDALPPPQPVVPVDEAAAEPRDEIERGLAQIWAAVLNLEQVGITSNFFQLGGDSIKSIQVVARAAQRGIHFTPKQLFQHQTIAELAAMLRQSEANQPTKAAGPLPLLPEQRRLLDEIERSARPRSEAVLLTVPRDLDAAAAAAITRAVLARHDALRLRFERHHEGWQATVASVPDALPCPFLDLASAAPDDQAAAIAQVAHDLQAGIGHPEALPLHIALFDLGQPNTKRLLLVIDALVIDQRSWQIVLSDLRAAYRQLREGRPLQLPVAGSGFGEWARQMADQAQTTTVAATLPYWLEASRCQAARLLADSAEDHLGAARQTHTVTLSTAETEALQAIQPVYRTRPDDLLLTALVQAIGATTGTYALLVTLIADGRAADPASLDLAQVVGCFTTRWPMLLALEPQHTPDTAIKAIKEQLRQVPLGGASYGLLRSMSQDPAVAALLAEQPAPEIGFQYASQPHDLPGHGADFGLAPELLADPAAPCPAHPIQISARIDGDRLAIDWSYPASLQPRIAALAEQHRAALLALIAHCESPEAGGCTPSDFPLARLSQAELDLVLRARQPVEAIYPLSPLQEHMFLVQRAAPEPGLFIVHRVMPLPILLDKAAADRALQAIIDHNPFLRTSFIWEGLRQPHQVVHTRAAAVTAEHDWHHLDADERDRRLDALIAAERARGFDLAEPVALRMTLVRMTESTSIFLLCFHYMRLDGWSLHVLIRDFLAYYDLAVRGEALVAEHVHPRYADYLSSLARRDQMASERFWRERLAGFAAPTPLIASVPGNVTGQAEGFDRQHSYVSAATSAALEAFVREQHLTLNTLSQAAWALVLSFYTGLDDVTFGVMVSGRATVLAEIEFMIGPFINILPQRIRITPQAIVRDWLRTLRAQQVDLSQHEQTRTRQIREWARVPDEQPLFESYLTFQNLPTFIKTSSSARPAELFMAQMEHPLRVDTYPGQQIGLVLSYYRRWFSPAAIDRLLRSFQIVLEALPTHADRPLAALLDVLNQARREE
ncbi:MAG TPA: amino acid adenylation domain-containing protein [Herpetosiphonaceae bacterium]